MNPRNMLSNNRMIEFDVAQQMQNQQHPEPYILLGSTPSFPQSSAHQILPTSGSIGNFDPHRLPEHQDGTALYRMPQYTHQVHPVANPEMGIPTPSTFYNPFLSPASGARMFSPPVNHGSMDQMPSSSNFVPTAAHGSGYGANSFPPNFVRGSSKRNGTEVFMGNNQYFNAPAAPSNVAMPSRNVGHFDGGVAVLDACFPLPEYRGNYIGQSFQPPNSSWCDRQPNVVGDSNTLSFNGPPISPYYEVSNITRGSSDMGNIGGQRFHEGASTSRGSQNLMHYTPPMLHPLHEFHPPQGIASRYNVNYRPPAATSSSRHPVNNTLQYSSSIRRPQQGLEAVPPPPGIRIFRSHRRSATPEGIHRHPDLPRLRLLEEGVAILEFSGHYEMGSAVDHHSDMRLDIDYMSYEELLALSERIGDVKTGLSEDTVSTHLKTRVHMATIDLEELPCGDEKNDSCVICQAEYEANDKIGSLECGHEYHVECLRKWLPVKNSCPICKSTALNVEQKSSGQIQ